MTATIFIDGEAGTTGLQIRERLEGRDDLALIHLDDASRKDAAARKDALDAADVAILCLPDDAAREAVAIAGDMDVRIIDTSTAHRTADGWVYGFEEFDAGQGALIANAERVSNPGCYACAGVSILHPLVAAGTLPADFPVTISAVSGYSGGGKSLIAKFEDKSAKDPIDSEYYVYGLDLAHKHVPEIRVRSGLDHAPLFMPSVGKFRQGMLVQVPLQLWALPGKPSAADIADTFRAHYAGAPTVHIGDAAAAGAIGRLDPEELNGTDEMRIYVFANDAEGQCVVAAQLDNLGKGAAGQAVQNLNLMLAGDAAA